MMIYIYFVFIHKYFTEAGIMSIKSSFNGIYNNCRVQLHIMSNKTFIYLIDSVVFLISNIGIKMIIYIYFVFIHKYFTEVGIY